MTQIYDQMLEPSGLTAVQFGLLASLNPEDGLSIGDLAETLVTDPTTLTRNIKPLAERGLLRTYADAEDRRRRLIALTKEGRDVMATAYPLWRKAQAGLGALLGASETASLNKALDRSLGRLTKHG